MENSLDQVFKDGAYTYNNVSKNKKKELNAKTGSKNVPNGVRGTDYESSTSTNQKTDEPLPNNHNFSELLLSSQHNL